MNYSYYNTVGKWGKGLRKGNTTVNSPSSRSNGEIHLVNDLSEYLEFGFPLGVDYSLFKFKEFDKNHLSALQKPDGVNKYFKVEVEKHAMFGPFEEPPFTEIHYSALMARNKPDGEVRIIVDRRHCL